MLAVLARPYASQEQYLAAMILILIALPAAFQAFKREPEPVPEPERLSWPLDWEAEGWFAEEGACI